MFVVLFFAIEMFSFEPVYFVTHELFGPITGVTRSCCFSGQVINNVFKNIA